MDSYFVIGKFSNLKNINISFDFFYSSIVITPPPPFLQILTKKIISRIDLMVFNIIRNDYLTCIL